MTRRRILANFGDHAIVPVQGTTQGLGGDAAGRAAGGIYRHAVIVKTNVKTNTRLPRGGSNENWRLASPDTNVPGLELETLLLQPVWARGGGVEYLPPRCNKMVAKP